MLPLTQSPANLAQGEDWLTPPERLVVAYAPKGMRGAWAGFFALERRLADAARPERNPMMIQLRLAWWRDRFNEPASTWPRGEPLLELLAAWDGERAALGGLVDGFEARNVGSDGGRQLGSARVEAMAALARMSGADSDAAVRITAEDWLGLTKAPSPLPKLPRSMRPLVILRGMAAHADSGSSVPAWREFLVIIRLGIFGR